MRDLGLLGELSFQSWCAQEGLIANGSKIDKTGWDFFVEFPLPQDISPNVLHKPAINCKIQIKATDKLDRKLQITVSNLRQMATAQMPAFYIFLEFDGKNDVQRAFVLHVNNEIIYSTLKRIHEIEQSDQENNLNKRKMTLKYNENNQLKSLDGKSLKENLLGYIDKDYSKYIEEKNKFLEKCGFENGYGKFKFSIKGKDGGLPELIDLSLGLIDEIDVENLVSIDERFEISSKTPNFELDNAKLKIGLLPPKIGKISFKKDKLSRPLTFDINFYHSPFNFYDYRKYSKFRIIGDFFDMNFQPYLGKSNYNFTLGGSKRLELKKLKDALALINLMSSKNQTAIVELSLENVEPLAFDFKSQFVQRNIEGFDEIIVKILGVCQKFEIYEDIYISLNELYLNRQQFEQFHIIMTKTAECDFKVDFELNSGHIFEFEQVACISVLFCHVGSHVIGAVVTVLGVPLEISENKFRVDTTTLKIEKVFTCSSDSLIKNEDIAQFIECISSSYEHEYDVFYNWGE